MENTKSWEDEEKWVLDSCVDHKGRVPIRASTGVWKASFFIIAIEICERLCFFGITASLIIYLTRVAHEDLKTAARNINIWKGVTALMPLIGGYLADAYLGQFNTVVLSSVIYVVGFILLTVSTLIPTLKACDGEEACRRNNDIFYFISIYLISIGFGGHRPSLESFGADQFDDNHPEERKKKMSFFNWWNVGVSTGMLVGVTMIVYVQDHVSWYASYITLTVIMISTIVILCLGRPFCRFRKTKKTPLIKPLFQVVVAAIAKRKLSFPSSPNKLYEAPHCSNERTLSHTDMFKFLDKAAILEDTHTPADKQNPWRLSTVTKVEELKLMVNLIPIWLTTVPFTICTAQTSTFFIKQAAILNSKVTQNLMIPPASVLSLVASGMIISITFYEHILVPLARRVTGTEQGISTLKRIGIGMTILFFTMIIAAIVEKTRLSTVDKNNPSKAPTMSIYWLAPQLLMVGFGSGFTLVGLQEHFYEQVPNSMRSIGIAFYLSVIGAGEFASSILIMLVDYITRKYDGSSWFDKDLNSSRLDYFYWTLAVIAEVNLCTYFIITSRSSFKSATKTNAVVCDSERQHLQVIFF